MKDEWRMEQGEPGSALIGSCESRIHMTGTANPFRALVCPGLAFLSSSFSLPPSSFYPALSTRNPANVCKYGIAVDTRR